MNVTPLSACYCMHTLCMGKWAFVIETIYSVTYYKGQVIKQSHTLLYRKQRCSITVHVCDVWRPIQACACWTEITPLKSFHPSYIKMALFNPYFTDHAQWTFIRGKVSLTDWTSASCYKFSQNIGKENPPKNKKKTINFDRMNSDTHMNRCYWWVTAAMLSLKSMEMEGIGCMLNISLEVLVCEVKEFKNRNSFWHVICQSLRPLVNSNRIKTTWNQLRYIILPSPC